jgi:hypothetical protein
MHPELISALRKAKGFDVPPNAADSAWPVIDEAAFHGLPGDVVRAILPHSEADPVAILIHLLAFFGNLVGRGPHYRVEADFHRTNVNAILVGDSSKGRKGTAANRVLSIVRSTDEQWADARIKNGLSSGEGLIYEVRDDVKNLNAKTDQVETVDPGASDKRLFILEAEFAGALAVMERPGNTLSPVIRNAWDGITLSTLTKNSPLKAMGAHISIVGHITTAELRSRLNRTDLANGFANRFLFLCVRRSKLLPHGGDLSNQEINALAARIRTAVEHAKVVDRVVMRGQAREAWEAAYSALSADRPGLLGAITARGEAQVIRLALLYSLLDRRQEIGLNHLRAALAVWEYCEMSAARIFGDALGDPLADEIHRALRLAGVAGMSRTAIRDLFGRHQSASRISAALALLTTTGRARVETISTGGRPCETWFAVAPAAE